jgi:hypothetical protein
VSLANTHSLNLTRSSFGEIREHPSALHLEALGDHVSLRDSLVNLGGYCHLDGLVQRGSSSRER